MDERAVVQCVFPCLYGLFFFKYLPCVSCQRQFFTLLFSFCSELKPINFIAQLLKTHTKNRVVEQTHMHKYNVCLQVFLRLYVFKTLLNEDHLHTATRQLINDTCKVIAFQELVLSHQPSRALYFSMIM